MDGLARRLFLDALGLDREVDHHDRVLLDDADEQDDPDDRDDPEVLPRDHQREQRAHARGRQRREDRDGVDVALVQHAQHDVHRDDRGQDQQQRVVERGLERQRRALEVDGDRRRHAQLGLRGADRLHGLAQRRALGEVERDGGRGELPDVVDDERTGPLDDGRDGRQRHLHRRGACRRRVLRLQRRERAGLRAALRVLPHVGPDAGGRDVDAVERARPRGELRLHLEHDAVLARLREDGRDEALAERVVERVVDRRRRDAEPPRGVAVDLHVRLQALVLQVGRHLGQRGLVLQPLDDPGHPLRELVRVRVLDAELVLRARHARLDRQVLHRLHVHRDADHVARLLLQAADDVARAVGPPRITATERLQVDQHAARVHRRVGAVDADERRDALDRGVGEHDARQRLLALGHRGERHRLLRLGHRLDGARVLLGEEPLRDQQVEDHRERERGHRDDQRQALVGEDPVEPAAVARDHVLEELVGATRPSRLALGRRVLEQPRAHHRRQRQRHDRRDQDGDRERDGELAEEAADHVAHEEERDQHREQRERERDDREADLLGALQCRLERRHALLHVAGDVLDHHDRVVDHEAGRDGQRHQRQVVDREPREVHHRERADQ